MPEEIHETDHPTEHPDVRYERSDAAFRPILYILLGALAFGVVVQLGMSVWFHYLRDYQAEIKKSPFPLAPGPSNALPRDPRLEQVDRLAGIETPNVFERETANLRTLNSYGPTEDKGFVHIPIERAMQLILERQMLPSRPAPSAEQNRRSGGLVDSGEPNSGRMFREGGK